jgi:hypothetical protein
MADWSSLPSWSEPVEVNETSSLQHIHKAIAKADIYQTLADEVTQIIDSFPQDQ